MASFNPINELQASARIGQSSRCTLKKKTLFAHELMGCTRSQKGMRPSAWIGIQSLIAVSQKRLVTLIGAAMGGSIHITALPGQDVHLMAPLHACWHPPTYPPA
eukprot:scaffold126214_cov15-Tisochrysis_lutea.AAC.1